jgi:ATP-binding cassette subfamily B protein
MNRLMARWRVRRMGARLVHQHETADCGPAALLTALRILGGDASLERVRRLAGTNAAGTTLFGLANAARALGIDATAVRGTYEQLRGERIPSIVHVVTEEGLAHFLVVLSMDGAGIRVADPAGACRYLARAAFERQWHSGAALLLASDPSKTLSGERPPGALSWILPHLRDHGAWIVQAAFTGVVCAALGIGSALLLQVLVDRAIPASRAQEALAVVTAIVATGLLRTLVGYVRQYFGALLFRNAGKAIGASFLGRLAYLDMRFFGSRKAGDIASRAKDVLATNSTIVASLGDMVIDATIVAGSVLVLAWMSPPLAVVATCTVAALGAAMYGGLGVLSKHQRRAIAGFARVETTLLDAIKGMHEIKTFASREAASQRLVSSMDAFLDDNHALRLGGAKLAAVAEATGTALLGFAIGYAALDVIGGTIKVGALMSIYALLGFALPSLLRLAQAFVAAQSGWISASRVALALGCEPDPEGGEADASGATSLRIREAALHLGDGRKLLDIPQFQLAHGELVVLAGGNGSGKSTFALALQRMHALQGEYIVGDRPAGDYGLDSLRSQVVVVGKAPHLFPGSLVQNLLMQVPAPLREVRLAALAANGMLPLLGEAGLALAEAIGDGERQLSAGERQLVGLARAIAHAPGFLVLDEAMSALDAHHRQRAIAIVRDYARDHAVLVVDHAWREPRDREYRIDARVLRAVADDAGDDAVRDPALAAEPIPAAMA